MPIEILAGTPQGGGQDRAARALAAALGNRVTVTNLPGRGGGNAWDRLLDHAGNASVVSISSPTIITNMPLGVGTIDDRDLTPLAQLCTEHLAYAVRADSEIANPPMLADRLATGDIAVSLAVARGNMNHMSLGAVIEAAGGSATAIEPRVFDSARYAIADIVEGRADMAIVSAASVVPELEDGSVRVVAVAAADRMEDPFAGVPTWTEHGIDVTFGTWRGLVGPPGLDREAIAGWDDACRAAMASAEWTRSVTAHRWSPTPLDSTATTAFLDDQRRVLTDALHRLALIG